MGGALTPTEEALLSRLDKVFARACHEQHLVPSTPAPSAPPRTIRCDLILVFPPSSVLVGLLLIVPTQSDGITMNATLFLRVLMITDHRGDNFLCIRIEGGVCANGGVFL